MSMLNMCFTRVQIGHHGYHPIGNSRFNGKNVLSENVHVKSYVDLKFWGYGFTKIKNIS